MLKGIVVEILLCRAAKYMIYFAAKFSWLRLIKGRVMRIRPSRNLLATESVSIRYSRSQFENREPHIQFNSIADSRCIVHNTPRSLLTSPDA
jgi:hypothetical protein